MNYFCHYFSKILRENVVFISRDLVCNKFTTLRGVVKPLFNFSNFFENNTSGSGAVVRQFIF